jgi:glucose/arabinose dehydrogenase
MRRSWPIFGLAMLAFSLLGVGSAAAVTLPAGFQSETVAQVNELGREHPTTFKFAPDGDLWVATRGGKILVFPPGTQEAKKATEFADLAKQTFDWGDHGLLGLALDPKFESGRPYVYALYSFNHELGVPPALEMPKWPSASTTGLAAYEGDECPVDNECLVSGRLVRLTAEGPGLDHAKANVSGEAEEKVLLEDWCQQSSTHSIGDLGFGSEGALYVSGGEGAIYTDADYGQYENRCGDPPGAKGTKLQPPSAEGGSLRSQSLLRPGASSQANGKVLLSGTLDRIDPDTGEGWPGNPEAASPNANARRIVGLGFRNPFRFVIAPRLGDVFIGNVGANKWEEIDRVPLGGGLYNSGWPCYEGVERDTEFSVLELNACIRLYEAPGSTAAPFFHYSHSTPVVPGDECTYKFGSAISGQAFYEGSTYPAEYDNAFFFADSVRGCIYVMLADDADGEPDPGTVRPFLTSEIQNYPGVDIEQGPGGSLYYATLEDGAIYRIFYDPEAVTARLKTTGGEPWGDAPLTVHFDASESTAPAGQVKYEWDLDGDGKFDDGTNSPMQTESFPQATPQKNVSVGVRVEDVQTHKASIARLVVYPGDSPPKVTIVDPETSFTWGVGQTIHFKGYAKSQEQANKGADMPVQNLFWKMRLLHCPREDSSCHEHPLTTFIGVGEGTVAAPDHSYPSYINFVLGATDARGLSASTSVKVKARPLPMQIRSEPPGIEIGIGETTVTTPAEYIAIENSRTTIAAPKEAVIGGLPYAFEGWSDGGARVHEVSSTAPAVYTARYRVVPNDGPPPSGRAGGGGAAGGGGSGTLPARPTLKAHPARETSSTTARFVFGDPAATGFQCKLDRGKVVACRSPLVYRHLKPGRHTVRIFATNGSQRSGATIFNWKIVRPRA